MKLRKTLWIALSLAILPALAAAKPAPKPAEAKLKLQPCKVPGEKDPVDAKCATYKVWENREAKSGRKIGVKVVVLPALSATPKPDPVFFLGGGPGEAIAEDAGFLANFPMRRDRDLVFINQRGTAEPDKLDCELGGHADDLQSYLGEMFPVAAVRECEERLAKKYDLTQYTTNAAVD